MHTHAQSKESRCSTHALCASLRIQSHQVEWPFRLTCARGTPGIASGDLDMSAERVDPYGGRKKGELEKMLAFMQGNKNQAGSRD